MCPWRGRSEGPRRARAASRSKGCAGATVPQPCPIERGRTTGNHDSHRAQVRARPRTNHRAKGPFSQLIKRWVRDLNHIDIATTTDLEIVGGLAWAIETPPTYRGSCSGVLKPPSRARTRVMHVVPRSMPAAPRRGGRGEFTQTAWRSVVPLLYSAHDYGALQFSRRGDWDGAHASATASGRGSGRCGAGSPLPDRGQAAGCEPPMEPWPDASQC